MQKSYAAVASSMQKQIPATHSVAGKKGRKRGVVYPLNDALPSRNSTKGTQMESAPFLAVSQAQKLEISATQRPSPDEGGEKSARETSGMSRVSGNSSNKAPKKEIDEASAGSNRKKPNPSKSPATQAGSSTTGQTRRPEAPITPAPVTDNDVDNSPATAPPEASEIALAKNAAASTSHILRAPGTDHRQSGTSKESKPDQSDDTAIVDNLSTRTTLSGSPDASSLSTSSSTPDQNRPDILQGLADYIRNIVLDEVNKENNQQKTTTDKPTAVDQTTQTDAGTMDRRDRLKDKYRERRRVKRQKDREQQSQEKIQQKKLLEESPPARPTVKLNPMASIFLPPGSSAPGLLPSSSLPILI